ncbi:uncharacterized protein [Blastocystis hominis]|uniref:Na+/H+ antiporter NhaC-like C-terminal domain-containing protein n=1 Tax=Blastocystis hominis TaxID=12968 RepID=D8M479_BLAHO|nr:uncharacterized protein [Blastocystis hominis]CBK22868.2 unnamed protein product [Blastocystis hominis]|eukprot:XP_012896916.1 uncharacterized protein [Blastocystis hominis]
MAFGNYVAVSVGWLSLIPPILAMVLALITKEVVSSLLLGCISACIIYSVAVLMGKAPGLEKANPVDVLFITMGTKIGENIYICLFLLFMGGLITLLTVSGGSKAYGRLAHKYIHGKRPALISTVVLGVLMFLDDYFNAITTGTVMRTVAEVNNVSKPKLAYLVHTIATNMCITIPLTSWAAAIVAQINDSGVENGLVVFLNTVPYNIYSILSFLMILITIIFDFDYGKMKFYEDNAKLGLSATDGSIDKSSIVQTNEQTDKGSVWDLLAPILALVLLSLYFMFYLGGFFNGGISVTDALHETSAPNALLYACFFALLLTLLLYVPRKLMSFLDWIENLKEGMKTMIPTLMILVLAWTISGTSGDLLQTGDYVGQLIQNSPIPQMMIPAVVFIVGMALSFSMGTAWGTFGVLIPIVVKICSGDNAKYLEPAISACLCGSVFGDNTSPISDTTVLVSSSTQCSFLVHVSTQLPYAITVAGISIIGYLIAGFTCNPWISLGASVVLLLLVLGGVWYWQKKHVVSSAAFEVEMQDLDKEKKKGEEGKGEGEEGVEQQQQQQTIAMVDDEELKKLEENERDVENSELDIEVGSSVTHRVSPQPVPPLPIPVANE